ncbi:hypothetical protein GCM10009654_27170 [Streptomyces hebeiensis]|uniref:Transcriptional regulator n=1 Tax=Streptomyces hebeiensis TaxID=229486 RepID=A0ABN1UU33_9ACTN
MSRPTGNTKLKSARVAMGYHSQQSLADALTAAAEALGIRGLSIGVRQIRRWESANPPWPQAECRKVLTHLLGQDLEGLGFTPPWDTTEASTDRGRRSLTTTLAAVGLAAVPTRTDVTAYPESIAADFEAVTRSHRRLYWSVAPAALHPSAFAHAGLGCALLSETSGRTRKRLAAAVAESLMLVGRIEFFDLREPDRASDTWLRALQAAAEADDPLLGAAILAHTAFIPGWEGRREEALERMVAARTYARRSKTSAEFMAWLDAVEAECETRCGNVRIALNLIRHGEDTIASESPHPSPEWMDWFGPARLAAFKGNTQLMAGHLPQARATLLAVLDELLPEGEKQATVVLGDLAAVEAAAGNPEEACAYATRALDQLAVTWYATGMDRVREVRKALASWKHERCVRDLDDRLYGWSTTVSALAR